MRTYKLFRPLSIYPKSVGAKIYDEDGNEIYQISASGSEASRMEDLVNTVKERAEEYCVVGR